jgi:hypothetical protein
MKSPFPLPHAGNDKDTHTFMSGNRILGHNCQPDGAYVADKCQPLSLNHQNGWQQDQKSFQLNHRISYEGSDAKEL